MDKNPEQVTELIFALLEEKGQAEYFGEPVSQIEHAFQSAQLAQAAGYDSEVILAALLHDIGHLCAVEEEAPMQDLGMLRHEQIGARFLRDEGFSEKICRLVEGHVQAKRYLTFVDPDYYERLSEASRQTLVFQGGIMTADEAQAFTQDELFELMIQMRRWDEAAKEEGLALPDFALFKVMLLNHLSGG